MADTMTYDATRNRLLVGAGYVENVTPKMWAYNVSGKEVLTQWFSYRRRSRERPLMGDKQPPSKLEEVRPDRWLPEYTTDLLDLLNVIGLLIDLEPQQAEVLEEICDGPIVTLDDLIEVGALGMPVGYPAKPFQAESAQPGSPELPF